MKDTTMKHAHTLITILLLTFCFSVPVSAAPLVKDGKATAALAQMLPPK